MAGATAERSFEIRTYGCQMNMHDSERLAGLLESAGYRRAGGTRTIAGDISKGRRTKEISASSAGRGR